jgi:hypothetical protein
VIHQRYSEVRTLIDIGGEDAKIIFFDEQNRPDMRMNGSCAGGTGAFMDEMATLLGVPVSVLDDLASRSTTIYPMASRCGVFAKTDLHAVPLGDLACDDLEKLDAALVCFGPRDPFAEQADCDYSSNTAGHVRNLPASVYHICR